MYIDYGPISRAAAPRPSQAAPPFPRSPSRASIPEAAPPLSAPARGPLRVTFSIIRRPFPSSFAAPSLPAPA